MKTFQRNRKKFIYYLDSRVYFGKYWGKSIEYILSIDKPYIDYLLGKGFIINVGERQGVVLPKRVKPSEYREIINKSKQNQ